PGASGGRGWYRMTRETVYPAATGGSPAAAEPAGIRYFYGVSGSRTTSAGWLARMGFADPARAERLLLADLGVTAAELRTDPLVTAVAGAADPDLAVAGLSRLFAAVGRGRDPPRAEIGRASWREG